MPTLWQILTAKKKVEVPMESKFYNPLGLRIGNTIQIDTLEFEKLSFTLIGLREVKGETVTFADYELLARPFDGDPVSLKLRLFPSGDSYKVVLLKTIGDCGYDKDFHDGLDFEKNKGEFVEGGETYYRVDDVKTPYITKASYLSDKDGSGKVDLNEVEVKDLTYWDYWRQINEESGNTILEFFIVEMNGVVYETGSVGDGDFVFLLGQEIDLNRVIVS